MIGRKLLTFGVLLTACLVLAPYRTVAHAGLSTHCAAYEDALPPCGLFAATWAAKLGGYYHVQTTRRTQAVSRGVELSLSVPRPGYPDGALIRVAVAVENVSHQTVWLLAGGPQEPGKTFPQVEVLNDAGTVVYPPAFEGYLPPPGPAPVSRPLAPGKRISSQAYVVLRGTHLRAVLDVLTGAQEFNSAARVATRPLTVRLTPGNPPLVTLTLVGTQVRADIEPLSPVHGPMLFLDAARCPGRGFSQHLVWTRSVKHLSPGCTDPTAWHAVAGWLNQSVATIDYTAPTQPPTVAPPPMVLPPTPPSDATPVGTTLSPSITATPVPTPTAGSGSSSGLVPAPTPTPARRL
mgnify:CR=1 FL=1